MSVSNYFIRNHELLFKTLKVYSSVIQNVKYSSNSENVNTSSDWNNAKPFSSIPGPKPAAVIGNLWRFFPFVGSFYGIEPHKLPDKMHQLYGNIVKISDMKFQNDVVLLYTPEDIETIFRNDGQWPVRDVLPSFKHYREIRKDKFGGFKGIFSLDGKEWGEARSKINPIMMQPRVVKTYTTPLNDVTQDFIEKVKILAKNSPISEMPENFESEINKWALENVCYIGLDIRLGLLGDKQNPKAENFVRTNLELFEMLYQLDVRPSLWKYVSTPLYKKYIKSMDDMVDFVVGNCEVALSKMNKSSSKPEQDMTVFEKLLKIDKNIAVVTVLDMLFAGIDTTSRIAAALLYYLGSHPEIQEKLRAEIMEKLPHPDTPVTSKHLDDLPYMRACIKETMRLAPIGVAIQRHVQKDLVLSGYQVPKGVNVILCTYTLCLKDEYFPEANKFIPDRWLRNNNIRNFEINPFVYYPFGFGPRICIGKRLASLELEIFLVKIIRNFKMEWNHGEAVFKSKLLYGIASPLKVKMIPVSN